MLAKRWTRCLRRSPYGIGWRMAATRNPLSRSRRQTSREVWLLPQPVRTATTAMTGRRERTIVLSGPSSLKSAPADIAREALAMTYSNDTSE